MTMHEAVQTAEQQRDSVVGRVELSAPTPTIGSIVAIEQEHHIAAAPEQVWSILTSRIGEWWQQPYRFYDDAQIKLDLRLRGTLAEHRSNGDAASWGSVSQIEHNHLLEVIGPCGMSGAVYGVYRFTLEADGEGGRGTRLQLSHHAFGDTSKAQQGDYDRGWREMLMLLKQVAEGA